MSELAPILSLIPQRPPFVMVSRLVEFAPTMGTSELDVQPDCILCEEGHLAEVGIMEHIAQTCAAYIGYRNRSLPIKIGVIGAVSNFKLMSQPHVGERIRSHIAVEAEVFDMLLIDAQTHRADGSLCATCQMKISLID